MEERWQNQAYTVDAVVATRAQVVEELKDALLRLPLTYRTAVVLHDMEGLTMLEIARIQEIRLPTAKQRLRRGRMILVSALARGAERRAARRVFRSAAGTLVYGFRTILTTASRPVTEGCSRRTWRRAPSVRRCTPPWCRRETASACYGTPIRSSPRP